MAKKKVKTKAKAKSTKLAKASRSGAPGKAPGACRYIEIINWKKAQPKMKGKASWMKLYTSLLDNDAFGAMNDCDRMLIVALWLYAARCGQYVFPADPKWLKRKIPLLNSVPDLKPLLEAKDVFGNPTPFIQYCDPPTLAAKKASPRKKSAAKPRAHARTRTREKKRVEKKRENRGEKSSATLSGCGKEERDKKRRVTTPSKKTTESEKNTTDQSRREPISSTQDKRRREPANPNESEAGGSESHIMPTAPRSASRNTGPQSIGAVLAERFPEHWNDPDAEQFGWDIVEALGMPRDPHNLAIRSEWGAFARFWYRIKKAAPALMLDELRRIAIVKAEFVASPKAKSAKNRSAVWTGIMYGVLESKGVKLPRVRDGPKQRYKR